jgi:hypothetical protein
MANKYIKECSKSSAIKEIEIKTTSRFHLITVRIAIKNEQEGYEKKMNLRILIDRDVN